MVAVYTTPDIADKKPPAATPALQPAALIRLAALTTSKPQARQLSDAAPRAGAITLHSGRDNTNHRAGHSDAN
jgi:hypothetical protein